MSVIIDPVLKSLSVTPLTSTNSLRFNEAVVTALNQNDQPMPKVTVNASANGLGAIVRPASETTGIDGTTSFKFRFGFVTSEGNITFSSDEKISNIEQRIMDVEV